MKTWQRISGETVYSSDYFTVHRELVRLPNGSEMSYDWYESPDFCVILPVTRTNRLVMIRNYRYPADEVCLEFPAGHINQGESPEQAARRELSEETGYTATRLELLSWYYATSRSRQKGYVFFARTGRRQATKREESEIQRVVMMSPSGVLSRIKKGEIVHAATMIAYTAASLRGLL